MEIAAPACGSVRIGGTRRRWLLRIGAWTVGLVASACIAASAFFRVQVTAGGIALDPRFALGAWASDLQNHLPWAAGFAFLTACVIPLRALQWRFTLGPRPPGFLARYHAIAIGAFVHNAAPGQLGEFTRALLLSKGHGLPFFESLGSVLTGKLLELAALVAVVALALAGPLGAGLSGRIAPALAIAGGLFLALFALAQLLAWRAERWSSALERKNRWPRLRAALRSLGAGLSSARSPRRAALALLASFGPVCASALAYGLALHGLGVPRGLFAGGVVLGAVCLGQLTPGLPIGTGMYYLTTSWAARSLGASAAQAAAFAALTHLSALAIQLAVGLASVILCRRPWGELLQGALALAGRPASRYFMSRCSEAPPGGAGSPPPR
jgi:uncharacterized protein (TIRG00374 family)